MGSETASPRFFVLDAVSALYLRTNPIRMYVHSQPAKRRAPNERRQIMYLGEPNGVKSTKWHVVGPVRQRYDGTRAAPQS